jgi:hypothetical protein
MSFTRTDDYWNTHPKRELAALKLLELLFFFITSAVWSFSDLKYKWDQYSLNHICFPYIVARCFGLHFGANVMRLGKDADNYLQTVAWSGSVISNQSHLLSCSQTKYKYSPRYQRLKMTLLSVYYLQKTTRRV